MAVWQFVFHLVPSAAATISGVVAARMNFDQLAAVRLDFSSAATQTIYDRVGAMLPEKPSLRPLLRIWGDEKTSDVQIGIAEDGIDEVQFRLHVGDLSLSLVEQICALARELDLVLVTPEGAVIRPYGEALVRTITHSSAAHYITDPKRFLLDASKRDPVPS